jgi:hypothetical protein
MMAIQQYSDKFWYPDSTLAVGVLATIFPADSNIKAPLFADIAGTIPLENPLPTGAGGVLTFYAEHGDYWLHINDWIFPISVGVSQEQSDLSTGTAAGGEFTPNLVTPPDLDIAPLVGYVVTQPQDGAEPTVVKVESPARTESLTPASLTRAFTWWLMDAAGNIIQQGTAPTPQQSRHNLILGLTLFDGTSTLLFDQTLPLSLNQPLNQISDLMIGLGPFNMVGNFLSPVPGTLSFNKTAGTMFARAFNFIPDPDNPHISDIAAQAPVAFGYNTQTDFSESIFGTMLDPTSYDVGGVVTTVPGVAWTIQRVWAYPLNMTALQVRVQYGQSTYASQADALEAIGNTAYIANPQANVFAALLGWIVMRSDATDLSDPTQAAMRRAGKFDSP